MNKNSTTMYNSTIIYSSKYPISIVMGLLIDTISLITFIYHIIYEELSITYGIFYILLVIILVDKVICPHAGKVILKRDKISFKYFFPWKLNIQIDTNTIKRIETNTLMRRFFSIITVIYTNDKVDEFKIQSLYGSMNEVDILKDKFELLKRK